MGVRILFIHPERIVREVVRKVLLQQFGDKAHCAPDTVSGLVAAKKRRPNLVFIYWRGSDLDAFDCYGRLRAMPGMKEIPVVFMGILCWRLWGKDPKEFFPKLQELGVSGYLNQPFRLDDLIEARTTVLNGGSYYSEEQNHRPFRM